jgi:hypothetical protein
MVASLLIFSSLMFETQWSGSDLSGDTILTEVFVVFPSLGKCQDSTSY